MLTKQQHVHIQNHTTVNNHQNTHQRFYITYIMRRYKSHFKHPVDRDNFAARRNLSKNNTPENSVKMNLKPMQNFRKIGYFQSKRTKKSLYLQA